VDALRATFTQGLAAYLEGVESGDCPHSMASLGIPYSDFGVELSAPPRGSVVWALLSEIGSAGIRERVVRHNDMARAIADRARSHPNLELLMEPTLSICCFRYFDAGIEDLDALNRRIHRQLMLNNKNVPSTTVVHGKLVLRPCFVGARAGAQQATELVDEVLEIGASLINNQED